MSKSLTESRIGTRAARTTLSTGSHWRGIDPDVHLGYRKGPRGGRWLVRWYVGDTKYQQLTIGTADDILDVGTLSFDAAVKRARETVELARAEVRDVVEGEAELVAPVPTVGSAIAAYLKVRNRRASGQAGREVRSDAASGFARHIPKDCALSAIALSALTEEDLKAWLGLLPANLKGATKVRLTSDFKAALNAAYRVHRKRLPADFGATVRHGLSRIEDGRSAEPIARDNQILTNDQVRRIIDAAIAFDADGDLARLIVILAATGARFSQARRMQVRDVQLAQSRLQIPTSRKGRGRMEGHIPVPIGADVLEALQPAMEGRPASEALLCRWRHIQVGPVKWERVGRGPWKTASEMLRPWRTIAAIAGLPGIVPYALRHSSIVRGIRAGLPIRLVAALHDTSVVMIERHYARWITDGLEDMVAKAVVPLVGTNI